MNNISNLIYLKDCFLCLINNISVAISHHLLKPPGE
ncbi:hypothetical protein YPPY54_1821, partial [Yersinia pestis PY-54]